jgi:F-type H+-transporting ATPase subunit b
MQPHTTEAAGSSNFLIPNATFFAEVIAFLIILFVIWKWVVPPLKRVMDERQAMIAQQAKDAEDTKAELAHAQTEYQKVIAEARQQAATIRDNATREAQRTVDEMHARAQEESARIIARGEEALANQRAATVRELRAEIGTLAVALAGKIVGESLEDEARRKGTVDRFLADLDSTTDTATVAG